MTFSVTRAMNILQFGGQRGELDDTLSLTWDGINYGYWVRAGDTLILDFRVPTFKILIIALMKTSQD